MDHFRWDESFTRVVPVTATGRATVEALELNRQRLQELRKLLHGVGLHPPQER